MFFNGTSRKSVDMTAFEKQYISRTGFVKVFIWCECELLSSYFSYINSLKVAETRKTYCNWLYSNLISSYISVLSMLCKNEMYDTSRGKEVCVFSLILVDWRLLNFGRWKLWLKLLKSKSACFESHVSRSCNFVMFQDWITNQKSWILYPFIANLWNYNKKKIFCVLSKVKIHFAPNHQLSPFLPIHSC